MVTVVSRRSAGLVKPTEVNRNVQPQLGGLAIHWGGDAQHLNTHAACVRRWRAWQQHHMGTKGWVDIAYNWGICDHGHLFVGRGWGVRSAANGTDFANDRFLAAVWLGGKGETPTDEAKRTFESLIQDCRKRGAGPDVRPHSRFYRTGCPGPTLTAWAAEWTQVARPPFPLPRGHFYGPGRGPEAHPSGDGLKIWQRQMKIVADGQYGPITRAAALGVQRDRALVQDGLIGVQTWSATWPGK